MRACGAASTKDLAILRRQVVGQGRLRLAARHTAVCSTLCQVQTASLASKVAGAHIGTPAAQSSESAVWWHPRPQPTATVAAADAAPCRKLHRRRRRRRAVAAATAKSS